MLLLEAAGDTGYIRNGIRIGTGFAIAAVERSSGGETLGMLQPSRGCAPSTDRESSQVSECALSPAAAEQHTRWKCCKMAGGTPGRPTAAPPRGRDVSCKHRSPPARANQHRRASPRPDCNCAMEFLQILNCHDLLWQSSVKAVFIFTNLKLVGRFL